MDSAFSLKKEIALKYSSNKKEKNGVESILYSRGRKRSNFLLKDSLSFSDRGDLILKTNNRILDGISKKAVSDYCQFVRRNEEKALLSRYKSLTEKINNYQDNLLDKKRIFISQISMVRLWNTSILVAVMVGMISMSFIYRYLGQGVSAKDEILNKQVAGTMIEVDEKKQPTKEEEEKYISELAEYLKIEADKDFNKQVRELVKGYPIEEFLPYLLDKDHKVVAFYIAIAKKESNWGKRVPVLNGKDCYNYVGYRGKSEKMGTGGHTCFANRKEAVDIVSKRIEELVKKYGRDTAKEMVVWKCGSSCAATGGQAAANKWISDVDGILDKLNNDKK